MVTIATPDAARLPQFARDCSVLDKKVTATDVDLVFAKIKAKGQRCVETPCSPACEQQAKTRVSATARPVLVVPAPPSPDATPRRDR